jgi:chaperonin GroES
MTRKYRKELAFIRSEVGQNTIVHGFLLRRAVCLFSWQSTRGFAGPQGDGRVACLRPQEGRTRTTSPLTARRHPFPHHAAGKFLLFLVISNLVVFCLRQGSPSARLYDNSVQQMEECMRFRPLHDRVVVRRIDAEEKTAGGIIIPDTAKEKPQQGEVIAVGPGGRDETGKLIPIDLKVGDHVLFGKWSGTEVKLEGVEYLIMKESDIMGVLEERAAKKKAA